MLPADIASLMRRWRMSSSVEGNGFQVDQLVAEYASVELATYHAIADTLNTADPLDAIVISYLVETVPWEIFRGTVVSWELQERFSNGVRETVGVLTAQDRRGVLNRTEGPDDVVYRGTEMNPNTLQRFEHDFLSHAMGDLCNRAGLPVLFEFDYPLTQNATPAGMTLGQAISHLLEPAQRAEGIRADFIRRGDVYVVRQRTIPLGTADVTIPVGNVAVRRYRKSRPRPSVAPRTAIVPAQVRGGLVWNVEWPTEDQSVCTDYEFENGFGRSCSNYDNGRLVSTSNDRTITALNGVTTVTETRTTYGYDTRGRSTGNHSDTNVNGVLMAQSITDIHYDTTGRHRLEVTRNLRRNRAGVMVVVEVSSTAKNETAAGAIKFKVTDLITGIGVLAGTNISEYSSGDLSGNPERADQGTALRGEPDDIGAIDISAQLGRALLECSVDVPLDPRLVSAGVVVEFSGTPSLVTDTRFYVVGVESSWEKGANAHTQTLSLEAWVT